MATDWLIKKRPRLALSFLLAFTGLLRKGEMTKLRLRQIAVLKPDLALITFANDESKGSRRKGEPETVPIRSRSIVKCLAAILSTGSPDEFLVGDTYKEKRSALTEAAALFGVRHDRLTPHGFRRGGATWYFSVHESYDMTCSHGRWAQVPTCRLYVDQANVDLSRSVLSDLNRAHLHSACLNLDRLLLEAFGCS